MNGSPRRRPGPGADQELHLTNTMTRSKERFRPREPGVVRLFTCGPSIYRRQHLGNYRTYLYEDVLHRYLQYLGYRVERLLNYTDVEDKAIEEAREAGVSLGEITQPVAQKFRQECGLLGIWLPESIPRASTSVDQAVRLIQVLLDHGYAYWHRGDVFYDPLKFSGFGRLYGLDMSRWPQKRRRFRRDTYPGQRWNLGDFILWHGARESDPPEARWQTALGEGRPAWNVQDAAMITQHLGSEIDLACGGVDNLYRHHDYTIAVVEAASGSLFCPFWLHGEHLLVDGEKMSKSRGNVAYLEELLAQGRAPGDVRLHLLSTHYREPLDLTRGGLDRDAARRSELLRRIGELGLTEASGSSVPEDIGTLERRFRERLNDDLDVAGAVAAVAEEVQRLHRRRGTLSPGERAGARQGLRVVDSVLCLLGQGRGAETIG